MEKSFKKFKTLRRYLILLREIRAPAAHFMFPGHMTVSGVVLCLSLAGLVGRLKMKMCWQIDDGVTGRPTGPPGLNSEIWARRPKRHAGRVRFRMGGTTRCERDGHGRADLTLINTNERKLTQINMQKIISSELKTLAEMCGAQKIEVCPSSKAGRFLHCQAGGFKLR